MQYLLCECVLLARC